MKSSLPAGIVHFTLFDKDFNPHCERLVFIRKDKQMNIETATNKTNYQPKEKVDLSLKVRSFMHKNIVAHLSVAVVDQKLVPESGEHPHILSSLLLTSDLKGYVENPNFYFKKDNETTQQALELLMMTQGWRRFTWKKVFAENEIVPKIKLENGFTVRGIAKDGNGWPIKNGTVTIIAPSVQLFRTTKTNEHGRFNFDGLMFVKDTKVFVKAFNKKGKPAAKIVLAKHRSLLKVATLAGRPLINTPNDQIKNYLEHMKNQVPKSELLEEVQVSAKRTRRGRKYEKFRGQLHSAPNYRLRFDEANAGGSAAANFLDYIRGKIPGLTIRQVHNQAEQAIYYRQFVNQYGGRVTGTQTVQVVNPSNGQVVNRSVVTDVEKQKEPIFLLDGNPVNKQTILSLPVEQVKAVDMLNSVQGAIYGQDAANGVMAVYTKETYDASKPVLVKPGEITFNFRQGYFKDRQFYVPPYNKEAFAKKDLPDLRSTIYWNPYVKVTDGEIKLSFYNAGSSATYKVIIEGISSEGEIGRKVFTYEVKQGE